jgi:hypothetical protein
MEIKMTEEYIIESAHFGEIAQYCDSESRLIIEWNKKKIIYLLWDSIDDSPPKIQIKRYWTISKAHAKYYEAIGRTIRGGWSLKKLKSGNSTIFTFQYKTGTKGNYKGED